MFTHATTGGAVARHRARPHDRRGSRSDLRLTSLLLTLLLSACGSDTLIVAGLDPDLDLSTAEIRIVSGASQEGEVATALTSPLVVEVVDASGVGLASVPIQWTFSQGRAVGGATAGQPTVQSTDAQGRSSVTWELGTTAGPQTAEAEVVVPSSLAGTSGAPGNNNGKKVGFQIRARPGSPTSIDVSPDAPSVTEGDSIQMLADVADTYGNPVEGVDLSWRSSNGAVAVVQPTGMAYALAAGQAVLSASWRSVEGSTTLSAMPSGTDTLPPPPPDPDPAQVNDLRTAASTESSVTLRWTEVGDGLGAPSDYELRIASPTMDWGRASGTAVEVAGSAVGSTREYVWSGLTSATAYQFQLVAFRGTRGVDAVYGPLSNVASGATQSPPPPPPPPPGGSQDYPNEPEGFTVITQRDFNALDENGWRHVIRSGRAAPADGGELYRIVQDPTAPASPNNVGLQVFTRGVDGGEPTIVWRDFTDRATRQMYVSVWLKHSENWQGHSSTINKVFYARIGDASSGSRAMLIARGQGSGPLIAFGVTQGTPLGDGRLLPPNTGASGVMERGRWHHAEMLLVGNDPDTYNGQYHMWLNGVKVAEYTDVVWTFPYESQDWWGIEWTPIWGGAGDTLLQEQRMWVDQFYVSGNS